MRRRIAKERPAATIWSVKFAEGGLIDLDFLAQYLQLRHAADQPDVLAISTQQAFANLAAAGVLEPVLAERLIAATRFLRQVPASSEERRVGKEWVSTGRSRWAP